MQTKVIMIVITEFDNCFIIYWKDFALRLNACFVGKKTQAKAFFPDFFNIPRGEVVTTNLCNYQADMTISPTALNQLKS